VVQPERDQPDWERVPGQTGLRWHDIKAKPNHAK